jgi:2-amino-1-hydroxyethylphosphonate dioxygenase (glycine-forming)
MNQATVNDLMSLLEGAQGEYFGEPVTQLDHALQCAQLARDAEADDETVLAALLHDIGHLIAEGGATGAPDHDQAGAGYLRQLGFSDRVVELIAGHVQAKRYLTAMNPDYHARLSEASKQTLALQGGPMSQAEAQAFERDSMFVDKLRLRAWDEKAKAPNWAGDGLAGYRVLIERHLNP